VIAPIGLLILGVLAVIAARVARRTFEDPWGWRK
jgi:hypothetical protein